MTEFSHTAVIDGRFRAIFAGVCERPACGERFEAFRADRRYCSGNCRKRDWARRVGGGHESSYRARLEGRTEVCECGGFTRPGEPCGICQIHAGAERRRERIARLWRQDLTAPEIAAIIGSTANSVGVEITRMRADGWDLPFRRREAQAA